MYVFAFFRHDAHPTTLHASLLAAHGLASFDEPVTYIRIIGEGKSPIYLSEGTVHQTLQAIECPITYFGSFEALFDEARAIANRGRYVLLDIPSYARMFLRRDGTIDISIALLPLPALAVSAPNDERWPPTAHPRTDRGHASSERAALPWILRCHQLGRSAPINLSEQAYSTSASNSPRSGELRVLPYEIPAMNDAQWSSLRAGAPLSSVRRASRILVWSLMLLTLERVPCARKRAPISRRWSRAAIQVHKKTKGPIRLMHRLPRTSRAVHQRRWLLAPRMT
jgi:hypothetical protein